MRDTTLLLLFFVILQNVNVFAIADSGIAVLILEFNMLGCLTKKNVSAEELLKMH